MTYQAEDQQVLPVNICTQLPGPSWMKIPATIQVLKLEGTSQLDTLFLITKGTNI